MSWVEVLVIGFLFFVFLVFFTSGHASLHEQAHVAINKNFGAGSEVVHSWANIPVATVSDQQYFSSEDRQLAALAHSFNESVSYNLFPLFLGLVIVNIFGFFYVGLKVSEKREVVYVDLGLKEA